MEKKNLVFALIFGSGIALVLLYKAYFAPFTHDESYTCLNYAVKPLGQIIWYNDQPSANNHLLNTLWIKFVTACGLQQAGTMRLLSWLGFILYAWAFFLFLGKKHFSWFVPLFMLAVCNPYLLDFFSMARGYGFSLGALAMGIAWLQQYSENQKIKTLCISWLWFTMACLANFNLVYTILPALVFVIYLKQKNQLPFKHLSISLAFIIPLLTYLYIPYSRLSQAQQLYFGGNTSLQADITEDQFWCWIYDASYSFNAQLIVLWNLLFWFSLAYPLAHMIARKPVTPPLVLSTLMLAGTFVLILINHTLTGALFPLKRTALFIVVLFLFQLSESLWQPGFKRIRMAFMGLVMLLAAAAFMHLAQVFHKTRFRELTYDRYTPEVLSLIKADAKQSNTLSLGVNWQLEPTLNFYRVSKHLEWLQPVERRNDSIPTGKEYYFVFGSDLTQITKDSLTLLKTFPEEDLYLYRNNSENTSAQTQ